MRCFKLLALVMLMTNGVACASDPVPLTHGHAHNDYQHSRPLVEAMERGFCSIEADVHVIRGQLLVAHDRHAAEAEYGSAARTLTTLYLDPLLRRVRENGGRVYEDAPAIFLLIDLKSDPPAPSYAILREALSRYQSMLTTWDEDGRHTRGVTVVITGNHTHAMIAADKVRYCASDGTLADLGHPELSTELCPLISSEWKKSFSWRGVGRMPGDERKILMGLVERAHKEGRLIRFWGAPDNVATWKELRAAGVDLINTDDLAGLQKFLLDK